MGSRNRMPLEIGYHWGNTTTEHRVWLWEGLQYYQGIIKGLTFVPHDREAQWTVAMDFYPLASHKLAEAYYYYATTTPGAGIAMDITFNSQVDWYRQKLLGVMLHELGHAFGAQHLSPLPPPRPVMAEAYNPNDGYGLTNRDREELERRGWELKYQREGPARGRVGRPGRGGGVSR